MEFDLDEMYEKMSRGEQLPEEDYINLYCDATDEASELNEREDFKLIENRIIDADVSDNTIWRYLIIKIKDKHFFVSYYENYEGVEPAIYYNDLPYYEVEPVTKTIVDWEEI